jgi:hypothetical protein
MVVKSLDFWIRQTSVEILGPILICTFEQITDILWVIVL